MGLFYLLPTLYGVLGRVYTPQLLMTGHTDAVVLTLPEAALGGGHLGRLLGALVTAGALAAFLSTSSGLLTSVAGVVFTDVLKAGRSGTVRDFRVATLLAASLPVAIYQYAGSPFDDWVALAWAGALLITVGVLALNITTRILLAPRK